jgi:hypothetical protein
MRWGLKNRLFHGRITITVETQVVEVLMEGPVSKVVAKIVAEVIVTMMTC